MNFTSNKNNDGRRTTFNEINITPLTDIFLVLLIIMMVIAPSFQSIDNSIKMPEINSGLAIEEKNATVSISKDGSMYVNEIKVGYDNLENKLASIVGNLEKKEVVVRADKETKSCEIMKVMKAAQDAGFEKLVVAGEPLSAKEQKDLEKNSDEVKE
ncbi:MAG: biopolymer transporter ExbD [Candidatus Gastranaerophilales bacterium]|nr:biopolymer transporter ExbD [Candidatus Gastranaerophilales bacterium]